MVMSPILCKPLHGSIGPCSLQQHDSLRTKRGLKGFRVHIPYGDSQYIGIGPTTFKDLEGHLVIKVLSMRGLAL